MKLNKKNTLLALGSILTSGIGAATSTATTASAATKNKTVKVNTKTTEVKEEKSKKDKTTFKTISVQQGDTTWNIAQDNDTTVKHIVQDNHLKDDGNLIHVNDKLKIRTNDTEKDPKVKTNVATASVSQAPQNTSYVEGQDTTQNTSYIQEQVTTQNNAYASNSTQSVNYTSNVAGGEKAAKEWIAMRESGGSYTARNASSGAYGRYQLLPGYLNGNLSPANQERVADNYVKSRYGSWTAAKNFWQANHWY